MVNSLDLHCIADLHAHWVETEPFEVDKITLDIITRLLDSAAIICIYVVGRFSKDFSELRGLRIMKGSVIFLFVSFWFQIRPLSFMTSRK